MKRTKPKREEEVPHPGGHADLCERGTAESNTSTVGAAEVSERNA